MTNDREVLMPELQEIWEAQRKSGVYYCGCTHAALVEKYGDRVYHKMSVGWFVRPEEPLQRKPSKVGERLMIWRGSPEEATGTIVGRKPWGDDFCYRIKWDDDGSITTIHCRDMKNVEQLT